TLLAERWPIALLSAVSLAGGIWVLRARRAGDLPASLARTAAIQVPIYLLVSGVVLPALDPIRTYAPAGEWVLEKVPTGGARRARRPSRCSTRSSATTNAARSNTTRGR